MSCKTFLINFFLSLLLLCCCQEENWGNRYIHFQSFAYDDVDDDDDVKLVLWGNVRLLCNYGFRRNEWKVFLEVSFSANEIKLIKIIYSVLNNPRILQLFQLKLNRIFNVVWVETLFVRNLLNGLLRALKSGLRSWEMGEVT